MLALKYGGIVLCGGRSSRMGLPKATLPFGPESMLARVVRLLRRVVEPIVVVAASGQQLPELGDRVFVVRDHRPDRGPLGGLHAGLLAAQGHVDAVYLTSCDVPTLRSEFVSRMLELLDAHDIVVPVDQQYTHPLAGVYRTTLVPRVEALLAENRLRPLFLIEESNSRKISVEDLREFDPDLASLSNLNTPADYLAALKQAGYQVPDDVMPLLNWT